jgi:hypothetical protein
VQSSAMSCTEYTCGIRCGVTVTCSKTSVREGWRTAMVFVYGGPTVGEPQHLCLGIGLHPDGLLEAVQGRVSDHVLGERAHLHISPLAITDTSQRCGEPTV